MKDDANWCEVHCQGGGGGGGRIPLRKNPGTEASFGVLANPSQTTNIRKLSHGKKMKCITGAQIWGHL